MKLRALLPILALSACVACGGDDTSKRPTGGNTGGGGDTGTVDAGGDVGVDTGTSPDTGVADGGTDTGAVDTGGTDTGTSDTGTTDTGGGDTTGGDTGMDGGGDTGPDVGMRLRGALVPLGHYGIGGNFALSGRIVPGPGADRTIKNGGLVVEPVSLEPKSP